LIVILEAALLRSGTDLSAAQILAHIQIGDAMHFFGLAPEVVLHGTGVAVVAILLVWHALTGDRWTIGLRGPLQLWFEGIIATAPLLAMAAFLGTLQGAPLAANAVTPVSGFDAILLAIGAGLSEELLFRMVGIGALHWLLVDVLKWRATIGTPVAILASTVAFTMYHDPSQLPAAGTVFIAAAGLYLGVVYVLRGFAVVVIAHAAYDAVVLWGSVTN
jgi:membrane protease YdiL (CAAX protease family)